MKTNVERDRILARLRERIFRFAASKVSGELAEDIAQDVLMLLHEKYAAVDRIEDLIPLSIEIARFKILGTRRKLVRRGEHTQISVDDLPLAGSGPDPYEQTARRERMEQLELAVASLGERCRELFRLKLEGFTFPEIQHKLGVATLNTLYTWDFRCRKQLAQKLESSR
jgi:RNA polymerase sigma-70 factor (ECF subfamily)